MISLQSFLNKRSPRDDATKKVPVHESESREKLASYGSSANNHLTNPQSTEHFDPPEQEHQDTSNHGSHDRHNEISSLGEVELSSNTTWLPSSSGDDFSIGDGAGQVFLAEDLLPLETTGSGEPPEAEYNATPPAPPFSGGTGDDFEQTRAELLASLFPTGVGVVPPAPPPPAAPAPPSPLPLLPGEEEAEQPAAAPSAAAGEEAEGPGQRAAAAAAAGALAAALREARAGRAAAEAALGRERAAAAAAAAAGEASAGAERARAARAERALGEARAALAAAEAAAARAEEAHRGALAAAQARGEAAREAAERHKQATEESFQKAAALQEEVYVLKDAAREASAGRQQAREEARAAQGQRERAERLLAAAREELEGLRSALRRSNEDARELNSDIKNLQHERDHWKKSSGEYEHRLALMKNSISRKEMHQQGEGSFNIGSRPSEESSSQQTHQGFSGYSRSDPPLSVVDSPPKSSAYSANDHLLPPRRTFAQDFVSSSFDFYSKEAGGGSEQYGGYRGSNEPEENEEEPERVPNSQDYAQRSRPPSGLNKSIKSLADLKLGRHKLLTPEASVPSSARCSLADVVSARAGQAKSSFRGGGEGGVPLGIQPGFSAAAAPFATEANKHQFSTLKTMERQLMEISMEQQQLEMKLEKVQRKKVKSIEDRNLMPDLVMQIQEISSRANSLKTAIRVSSHS